MFASDALFSPATTAFRPPMTLRTPFTRKGSEALISPLSSPSATSSPARFPSSHGAPPTDLADSSSSSSRRAALKPKRRSSNPLVLAKSNGKSTGALAVACLLLLGWFWHARSSPAFLRPASILEPASPLFATLHASSSSPRLPANVVASRLPSRSALGSAAHDEEDPLTMSQELAALTLFLTSGATHILPDDLDPQRPLDPNLVLDSLLPASPAEREAELRALEDECWLDLPVVVVGKHDMATRQAHDLLHREDYFGRNGQGISTVYVDRRSDTPVLSALLARLTLQKTLPVVLIGGVPIGGHAELQLQHDEGHLLHLLERVGAVLGKDAEKRHLKERQRELTGRKAVAH